MAAHRPTSHQAGEKPRVLTLAELEIEQTRWQHRLKTAQADVTRLEAETFKAMIAGRPQAHRASLNEARAQANEAGLVLAEIARQLPLARAVDYRNQAAALRAEVEADKAELERLRAEIETHLKAIEVVEGVRYERPNLGWMGSGETNTNRIERRISAGEMKAIDLETRAVEIEVEHAPAVNTHTVQQSTVLGSVEVENG